jgi:hypothetical protein
MDFMKKLKKVFIVEDTNAPALDPTAENTTTTSPNEPSVNPGATGTSEVKSVKVADTSSLSGTTPDQKFIDLLFGSIEKSNLQGFDYLEFKESLISLSKVSMDDATRYKSALAMASTMNATPESLTQAANHYLSVLNEEREKFNAAVAGQRKKIQTEETQGIQNLQSSIQMKEKQIEELNKEIQQEKEKLKSIEGSLAETKAKVEDTAVRFQYAYDVVSNQIVEDIKNISQFGK